MAIFGDFFASCICSEPRAAHFRPAEIRRGKKRKKKKKKKKQHENIMVSLLHRVTIKILILECGPMPNVMAALPNMGGALCSTPQSSADAHY